jgi:hypothetical protein
MHLPTQNQRLFKGGRCDQKCKENGVVVCGVDPVLLRTGQIDIQTYARVEHTGINVLNPHSAFYHNITTLSLVLQMPLGLVFPHPDVISTVGRASTEQYLQINSVHKHYSPSNLYTCSMLTLTSPPSLLLLIIFCCRKTWTRQRWRRRCLYQ